MILYPTTSDIRGTKMKVDVYTKIILTIIAACLVFIVIRDIHYTSEAQAQTSTYLGKPVMNVQIVGINEASHLQWEPIKVQVVK